MNVTNTKTNERVRLTHEQVAEAASLLDMFVGKKLQQPFNFGGKVFDAQLEGWNLTDTAFRTRWVHVTTGTLLEHREVTYAQLRSAKGCPKNFLKTVFQGD